MHTAYPNGIGGFNPSPNPANVSNHVQSMTRISGSRLQQQSDGSAGSILHFKQQHEAQMRTTMTIYNMETCAKGCELWDLHMLYTVGTEFRREREREKKKKTYYKQGVGCIPF